LDADGSFDGVHVVERQGRQPGFEALLADGGDLVGHSFAGLAVQIDWGLTRVNAGYATRNGHDLNAVQIAVGRVVSRRRH